jgi:hypothetical protein
MSPFIIHYYIIIKIDSKYGTWEFFGVTTIYFIDGDPLFK